MKAIVFLLTMLLATSMADAQHTLAYPTITSLAENKPDTIERLTIVTRGQGSKKISGNANEYQLRGVKAGYILVSQDSSEYVNCQILLGQPGYAKAFFRSKNYIYFIAAYGKKAKGIPPKKATKSDRIAAGLLLGGIPGAMIVMAATPYKRQSYDINLYEYLYDIRKDEVIYFNNPVKRRYIAESTSEEDAGFVAFTQDLFRKIREQEKKEFAEREY